MPNTTPAPIGADGLDRAFLKRVLSAMVRAIDSEGQATVELDALRSCVTDLAALLITSDRAALASAAQPAAAQQSEVEDTLVEYAMQIAHERELHVLGHKHDSEGALQRFRSAVARFAAAPKAAPAPAAVAGPVAWYTDWHPDGRKYAAKPQGFEELGIRLDDPDLIREVWHPLYAHPSAAQEAALHYFDAGWKAAARFCDREDAVADGIIGHGACPQFERAFDAARAAEEGATNAGS